MDSMDAGMSSGDEQQLLVQVQEPQGLSKKGTPWSVEEHYAFLRGLEKLGRGNWRGISRFFVPTRTPTQVASHAQKHFLRLGGNTKRRSRFSAIEEELYGSSAAAAQSVGAAKPTAYPKAGPPPDARAPMAGYKAAVAAHAAYGPGMVNGYTQQGMVVSRQAAPPAPYTPPLASLPAASRPDMPMPQAPGAWMMPQYMPAQVHGKQAAACLPAGSTAPAVWMPMAWPGMQFAMAPVVTLPGAPSPQQQQQGQGPSPAQQTIASNTSSPQQSKQDADSCANSSMSGQGQVQVQVPACMGAQLQGMQVHAAPMVQGFPCMPPTMLFQGYPPGTYFSMPSLPAPYMATPPSFPAGPVVSYPAPPEEPVCSNPRCSPPHSAGHAPAGQAAATAAPAQPRQSPASSTSTSTQSAAEAGRRSAAQAAPNTMAAVLPTLAPAQEAHHLAPPTLPGTTPNTASSGNSQGNGFGRDATDVLLAAAAAVEAANAVASAPLPSKASQPAPAPGSSPSEAQGGPSGGPVCVGAGPGATASFQADALVARWTPAAVDLLLSQVVPDSQAAIAQAQARLSPPHQQPQQAQQPSSAAFQAHATA